MKYLLLAIWTLSLPVAAQLQTPVRVVRASPPGEFTNVHAAVANFDGVINCTTLVASASVVSPSYTPGAGNVW